MLSMFDCIGLHLGGLIACALLKVPVGIAMATMQPRVSLKRA